ncbi:MAG: hypothetical protein D3924_08230 [Candidatus Electrothrix sp. AR4]|nr:hypothetical protein [Candidatus Electrothrix sp. AR4]
MTNLIWIVFISLLAVLAVSFIWFIWRLRHFSQSNHQTVLDDKLLQNMLGDEALSKDLKNALVGKSTGTGLSGNQEDPPASDETVTDQVDDVTKKDD